MCPIFFMTHQWDQWKFAYPPISDLTILLLSTRLLFQYSNFISLSRALNIEKTVTLHGKRLKQESWEVSLIVLTQDATNRTLIKVFSQNGRIKLSAMSTKKIKNVTDNISGKYYENVFTRKETFILGLLLIHKMLHLHCNS